MKQLFIALLLVAFASAAFKMRHSQLRGLQRTFRNLDNSLLNQIANAKHLINRARIHRNNKHASRRRALLAQRRATSNRVASEANYNAKKHQEELAIRRFKVAHKVYIQAKRDYARTHRDQSRRIRQLDHERSVIEQIRRLLGVNHSKNWRRYVKDKGVRYVGKSHKAYRHDASVYNKKLARFTRGVTHHTVCKRKSYYPRSHTCSGLLCCKHTYWRLSGGGRHKHSTQCYWKNLKCTPKGRNSLIVGTADNAIHVYVNGRYLGQQQGTQRDWTKSTAWRTKLKKGDVVQVYAENHGRYSAGNPGGVKMEIRYGRNTFYTNTHWRCQPHRSTFLRTTARQTLRVPRARIQTYRYPPIRGISNRAQWIWHTNYHTPRVDCFFVVPF